MALPLSQFSLLCPSPTHSPKLHLPKLITHHAEHTPPFSRHPIKLKPTLVQPLKIIIPRATQQENGSESTRDPPENETRIVETDSDKIMSQAELGDQIRNAMKEREKMEEKRATDFWSGVGEEIREIEWPAFNKVLGTTGVVIGVIVGSSAVLLTLNAVLAELSDTVFAGKGVQDFFS